MADKKIENGGRAFPQTTTESYGGELSVDVTGGMSLRAYIATKVIGGLCANPSIFQANDRSGWDLANCTEGQLADCAVRIADEMILSLKAGE